MNDPRTEFDKLFTELSAALTGEMRAVKPEQPVQDRYTVTFDASNLTDDEKLFFAALLKKVKMTVKKR